MSLSGDVPIWTTQPAAGAVEAVVMLSTSGGVAEAAATDSVGCDGATAAPWSSRGGQSSYWAEAQQPIPFFFRALHALTASF